MTSSSKTCIAIVQLHPDVAVGSHRTGRLSHVSEGDISNRLGFEPARDSVAGKSDQEWQFTADGRPCAIWDAKGSGRHAVWSTFGPAEVFTSLFGWRAVM